MPQTELFQFPRHLPNDLECFCVFYPKKFPSAVAEFEKLARTYFKNPGEFKKLIYQQQKELFAGFYKIKNEYDVQTNKTPELILKTDERLHKLFCFKFWMVNYGFCDGPLHDFYVERIKQYSERIAAWDNPDDKENSVQLIERTLLQGDYADLYLQRVFTGIKLYDSLAESVEFAQEVRELKDYIARRDEAKAYRIIDAMIQKIVSDDRLAELKTILTDPLKNMPVRGDNLEVCQVFIQAFEFHEQNLKLQKRHQEMTHIIAEILAGAKEKLNTEEYEELKVCYEMSNLFKEAKDVYGEIDAELLPFWFGMLENLASQIGVPKDIPFGHSGAFYVHVWYLPEHLKARVFTPDVTGYEFERL
ncbi:MAG TPA: hypothetical protein VJJ82_02100 [Candidatus Nanoarchaeia archaeon]|nr:hypothetical protein [Candidatus Nanoarchaeia archaeon]